MLLLSCRLLAVWGIVNSLQWHRSLPNWQPHRAFGWELQGSRQSRLLGHPILKYIFQPFGLQTLIYGQLAASLFLGFAPLSWLSGAALLCLGVATTLLNLRANADGADKMALVITWGLLLQLTGYMLDSMILRAAGFLWIGGQLIICYATSGIAKLNLRDWRNGMIPQAALSSYQYGHGVTFRLLNWKWVALILAWSVILLETLFPLAILGGETVLVYALALMSLLHAATAVFMGLNTYPLAFFPGYPSLLLLAEWVARSDYF